MLSFMDRDTHDNKNTWQKLSCVNTRVVRRLEQDDETEKEKEPKQETDKHTTPRFRDWSVLHDWYRRKNDGA